jgi:MFS family permease
MPYSVLMPIFADTVLHRGAHGFGILMGATGLGALAGSMSLAVRSNTLGLGKLIAFMSAGFGAALIFFSFSHWFWVSVLALLPAGFCFMVQMAASNTLIQTTVPDNLRGRVMAVHVMTFMGMAPFGSVIAGSVAEKLGAPLTLALGGLACLAGSIMFAIRLPKLQITATTSQLS